MTLQEHLDSTAQKYGSGTFKSLTFAYKDGRITTGKYLDAVDEAAEAYAEEKCREQRVICSDAARYMNILGSVSINKQSILKAPLATEGNKK